MSAARMAIPGPDSAAERSAASRRGASARNKGASAERAVAAYFRAHGWPDAERAVATGWRAGGRESSDPGDVRGVPGVILSVKDHAKPQLGTWYGELGAMSGDAVALRLLVVKRRQHPVERWWAYLAVGDLVHLAIDGGVVTNYPGPSWATELACLPLRVVTAMLISAGYQPVGSSE